MGWEKVDRHTGEKKKRVRERARKIFDLFF
jgi:hypothetical protein